MHLVGITVKPKKERLAAPATGAPLDAAAMAAAKSKAAVDKQLARAQSKLMAASAAVKALEARTATLADTTKSMAGAGSGTNSLGSLVPASSVAGQAASEEAGDAGRDAGGDAGGDASAVVVTEQGTGTCARRTPGAVWISWCSQVLQHCALASDDTMKGPVVYNLLALKTVERMFPRVQPITKLLTSEVDRFAKDESMSTALAIAVAGVLSCAINNCDPSECMKEAVRDVVHDACYSATIIVQ
jgi:hypothetical protein